jgi:hypothetical protein
MSPYVAGTVLAARGKGAVTWQARISHDRGRLEVVGIVPASAMATVIEPLDERELRELLGEGADLDDRFDQFSNSENKY